MDRGNPLKLLYRFWAAAMATTSILNLGLLWAEGCRSAAADRVTASDPEATLAETSPFRDADCGVSLTPLCRRGPAVDFDAQ